MVRLFEAIEVGSLSLSNRLMISPMCQYSADEGNASSWHMSHLTTLAQSGAALLCLEATAVSPVGRISQHCLGLWNEENETALGKVIGIVRDTSPIRLAIQLAHAGRKGSSAVPWRGGHQLSIDDGGWTTLAPSALPQRPGEVPAQEMSLQDIHDVRDEFVRAAQRAVRIGFDAIEVHAAHGYLLHQFLSPVANHRTDVYGGSVANRMRFPLEVFDAIRASVPDSIPVGVRVPATDWETTRSSWTLEDAIAFAAELEARGAGWIDMSSGGMSPTQKIDVGPSYQVPFAQAIKQAVKIPVVAVGLITEPYQAEAIVRNQHADIVALGRAVLYNPRWPWHAAARLGAKVYGAEQYWRCVPDGTPPIFGDTIFGQR